MNLPAFVETVKRRADQNERNEQLIRDLMIMLESHDVGEIEDALKRVRYRLNLEAGDDE